MIVTEIKKIGKGQRYYVEIDEFQKFTVEADVLVRYKLKTGDEIDADELNKMLLENGEFSCFDRALIYLEKNMKTEKGIRDYLKQKGFLPQSIDNAVDKLKEYGYINDENFTECYIRTYGNKKGRKKIKYELISKGVDINLIDVKIEELVDEDEEINSCKELFRKYMKNKQFDLKTKQKAVAHLVSKGFTFNVINRAMGEELCELE